jgi:tight adherence protein B
VRNGRRWLLVAAAMSVANVALALGASAAPPEASPDASTDGGELDLTRLDTSAYPSLAIDLAVPAIVLGGAFSADRVSVAENGQPVDVGVEVIPPTSLEVVLVFDTSGSMDEGAAIAFARNAAEQFLASLPEGTQVGIVGFSTTPSLVSPLTSNRAQLLEAIRAMRASGKTSLYDAIVFGQQLFSGASDDRHFVVLSDGGDTSSVASLDEALAVSSSIRTSVVELVTSESDHDALQRLAAAGSGSISAAADGEALGVLFREIADDLINRVRVRFTTAASGETTYTFKVATPTGVVEKTVVVTLPIVETPTTTSPPTSAPAAPATSTPAAALPAPKDPPATMPDLGDVLGRATGTVADDDGGSPPRVLLVLGAAGVFAGMAALLGLSFLRPPDPRTARRRLGAPEPEQQASVTTRVTQATDRWLERSGRASRLSALLDVAGVSLRPGEFLVLVLGGAIASTLLLVFLIGPLGLLCGPPLAVLIAAWILTSKRDKRRRAFAEQLPDVLQLVVSSLRAGYGLPQALSSVAEQADEPARTEFQRVQFEARIGRDPSEALRGVAERMASTDFDWVVAAIDINREIGGELAQILDHVAETIRERQRLHRQIRTLTAEGRLSAVVLTALPLVLFGVLKMINPTYFEPLTKGVGVALVVLAVVLLFIGWLWMRRLVKVTM